MAISTTASTRSRTARTGGSTPVEQASAADQTAPSPAPIPAMRLEQLDPGTLLIEGNIRSEADLDPEFLDSIRDHGVLQPIVAVQTEQGIQVRYGQRRTLAAIKTGRDLVPVVIVDASDSDQAQRIINQWHENEHRRGLTVADQIGAAEQLAAFGIPAEQIGKQLGTSTENISHALAAAKSPLARKAAPRYNLTLEQSAAIAEFESDPESVKLLVIAAGQGQFRFEHELERLRALRVLMEKKAAAEAKLTKAKVRIITHEHARTARVDRLESLAAEAPSGTTYPPAITVAQHRKCPGHAAYLQVRDWAGKVDTVYVCTDWQANGHHQRYAWRQPAKATQTDPETAREERRTVRTNNKAWDTATAVRHRFLKTLLSRSTPVKGSAAFLAGELMLGGYEIRRAMERGSRTLRELLGHKDHDALKVAAAAAANAADPRAQVLALAVVLAAIEESLSRDTWRDPSSAAVRYFSFLTQHGYQTSDVEQLVLPTKHKPRTRASGKDSPPAGAAADATNQADEGAAEQPPAPAEGTAA